MTESRTAEVGRWVAAPPEVLYDLVSDVSRMGEWSPETASCRWVDGAGSPAVGARFVGSNRRGPLLWSTSCRVTVADRGREFAFAVTFAGLPISEWRYTFTADGDGCQVVETWQDRRTAAVRLTSVPVMGIADRAAHNRRGMVATLDALARAAEGPTPRSR